MIFGRARATATAMFGGLVLSIAGCSDLPGPDGTNLGEQLQFSEEIDLQQFEDLLGNRVRVEIRLGDGLVASRVGVRKVDLENQTFTLDNGVVVRLTDESVIVFSADGEGEMKSLEHVVEALNDEKKVIAAWRG